MRSTVMMLTQFCALCIIHSQVDCLPRGNQIKERYIQFRVSTKGLCAPQPVNCLDIQKKNRFTTWSTNRKAVLSLILSTAYMSIVLSVMSLPVCLTAIYADSSFYSDSIKCSLLSKIVSAGNVSNVSAFLSSNRFCDTCALNIFHFLLRLEKVILSPL